MQNFFRLFRSNERPPPRNAAKYFTPDPERAPSPKGKLPRPEVKGGNRVGPGWEGLFIKKWPYEKEGFTEKTNPLGMMRNDLMHEVTKYGDFAQLTYPNFKHFGDGIPQIQDPSRLLPKALDQSGKPAEGPSWITTDSPIYDYEILEDDRFYLEATSGIYPGEFGYTTRTIRKYLPFLLKLLPGGDSNAPESRNWIGYVAATKPQHQRDGERDLVIVFRGTQAKAEWVSDITAGWMEWSDLQTFKTKIKVEKGFEAIYRRFDSTPGNTISIQGQVHVAVRTLLAKHGDNPKKGAITSITTAGHSLGGALASMCAFDLAWSRIGRLGDKQDGDLIPVTAFTFEAPRVGNEAFAEVFGTQHAELGDDYPEGHELKNYVPLKSLRVVNLPDVVPKEPCFPFSFRYILPWYWWKGLRFFLGTIAGLFIRDARFDWFLGYRHGGAEYSVNTESIWPRPPLTSVERWWWLPNTVRWWLRLGDMHSLMLALFCVDPKRGPRMAVEKPQAMQNGHATH